jgi:hypothetical protein
MTGFSPALVHGDGNAAMRPDKELDTISIQEAKA